MSWVDRYVQTKARTESERGPDGSLQKWKAKDKRSSVIIFHHVEQGPQLFWAHQFPRKVTFKDKETGEPITKFWGKPHMCLEDESFLFQQYKWEDGVPKARPERCPLCKLVTWVREQVETGQLDWLEPIFEFEDLTLVAAGIYNYLNKRLHDTQVAEMKKKKISPMDSWKQSAVSKAQWLFTAVDNESLDDGLQVVVETNLLGEMMQEVVMDAQESLGVEDGDYCKHPYAIEWIYDPGAKSFSDKYKARRIERIKLSSEIEDLIRGPIPKERIAKALEKPNMKLLRDFMEEYCVLKDVPFDEFFADAEGDGTASGEVKAAKPAAKKPEAKKEAPKVEAKKEVPKTRTAKKEPEPEADGETLPCDKCHFAMKVDATECPKCGTKYELSATDEETDF